MEVHVQVVATDALVVVLSRARENAIHHVVVMGALEVVRAVLEAAPQVVLTRVIQGAMVNVMDVRHAVVGVLIHVALVVVDLVVAQRVVAIVLVHVVAAHVDPDVLERVLIHAEQDAHQNRLL